jgi:hypothetical protein
MPTDVKPNLFLVGAQKSGTSALAGWLRQHPQVFISFPKEPGFLAFGENGYPYKDGYGNVAPASQYVVNSERAYLGLFANASSRQTVVGEASTWYFALPGMATRIKAYNPDAKLIVILRDPVERAYSAWCHARSDQLEPCEDFSAALAMEAQRGEVEFLLRYRRMGLYSQALAEYQATFPPEQFLVLFYEDLRANPSATWKQMCDFLGIDASQEPAYGQRYNRAGQPRHRWLHRLLRSHRLKSLLRPVLPHRIALGLKQQVDSINLREFPAMDAQSRAELCEYFRPDIEQLRRLTKRDLVAWLK